MTGFHVKLLLWAAACTCAAVPTLADEQFAGRKAYEINRKTTCGTLEAGVTRYGIFEGRAYARIPGQKDRHLFNVLGVNTRQCGTAQDAERGAGFRSVSREVMLYLDPETNAVLDGWRNPWTGDTVTVVHVANDPVNMREPAFERTADGSPAEASLRRYGDLLVSATEYPLYYRNPLGGDYQDYVGGYYHAMEMFNSFYRADELLDPSRRLTRSWVSWTRVAQWLPWMKMADLPGVMIISATGSSIFERSGIPEPLKSVLERDYPEYFEPPPVDDARANETSWTVFRRYLEDQDQ
jgi:hypothetical protein